MGEEGFEYSLGSEGSKAIHVSEAASAGETRAAFDALVEHSGVHSHWTGAFGRTLFRNGHAHPAWASFALQGGITLVPGHVFSATSQFSNFIRLNAAEFSYATERALERLGGMVIELAKR